MTKLMSYLAVPAIALSVAYPSVAAAPQFQTVAPVAFMKDLSSGAVLFAKDADRRMPPASMAKMMTAYVIFDPSHLDNPPDLAYYAATEEETDTFYAGCEIVDTVEPEDIVS